MLSLMAIVYIVNLVLLLSMLFLERGDPHRVMLWLVIMVVFPVLGFVLYLVFGQTFYSSFAFRPKRVGDVEIGMLRDASLSAIAEDASEGFRDAATARGLANSGAYFYSKDNDVALFTDGNDKFAALIEDLKSAKRFIHLEYYIIRKDELGDEIVRILTEKASEGVEVRLLADGIGYNTSPRSTKALKEAGGQVALFHNSAAVLLSPKKNNRNHRKIAVIDGRVGYIGGFNIGVEYLGKGPMGHWRDGAVRITGSAVDSLAIRFLADWRYASKEDLFDGDYYADDSVRGKGKDRVQIVSGGPDMGDTNGIAFQYLMMLEAAEESLYIYTPYLAPNQACMSALRSAAMRGVDVRIVIPDKKDHPFVYWCNRRCAAELMKDGVRVFEYNDGFVHSKTVVVDGRLCSVGSANFDDRSMALNFEANAMVYSEKLGSEMVASFMSDLESCTEYTLEKYESRTLMQRIRTVVSWLVSSQL